MVAAWRFENFEKMKNRSLPLAVRLIFLALPAFAAQAAEGTGSPEQRADWEQRFSKAKALSAEGHARRERYVAGWFMGTVGGQPVPPLCHPGVSTGGFSVSWAVRL